MPSGLRFMSATSGAAGSVPRRSSPSMLRATNFQLRSKMPATPPLGALAVEQLVEPASLRSAISTCVTTPSRITGTPTPTKRVPGHAAGEDVRHHRLAPLDRRPPRREQRHRRQRRAERDVGAERGSAVGAERHDVAPVRVAGDRLDRAGVHLGVGAAGRRPTAARRSAAAGWCCRARCRPRRRAGAPTRSASARAPPPAPASAGRTGRRRTGRPGRWSPAGPGTGASGCCGRALLSGLPSPARSVRASPGWAYPPIHYAAVAIPLQGRTRAARRARFAKAHMLASRSALPVSSVITAETGPATAMQAWPGASP